MPKPRKFFESIFFLLVKYKLNLILSIVIIFNIRERRRDSLDYRFFSRPRKRVTILALDSKRYRGDLDVLSRHDGFRVLHLSQSAPGWLVKLFLKEGNLEYYLGSNASPEACDDMRNALNFMRGFLGKLYSILSVDCVTTVNYRYIEDYCWAKTSNDMGVKYIMLYRECMFAVDRIYDMSLDRTKRYGQFHGAHIIVHNSKCKQMLLDANYCKSSQVTVAGALRMDGLINKINKSSTSTDNKRKKFVLFYFPHNMSLFGGGGKIRISDPMCGKYPYHYSVWEDRIKLFTKLHSIILELAIQNPDIDFVIKPKMKWVGHISWDIYKEICNSHGVNGGLPNYVVDPNADVHNLILSSDIICALQSSAVLESMFAGKRVIFPLFFDYMNSDHYNDFAYKDNIELFDIAENSTKFKSLFYQILENPYVADEIMDKRYKLFKTHFNQVTTTALDRYVETIYDIVRS